MSDDEYVNRVADYLGLKSERAEPELRARILRLKEQRYGARSAWTLMKDYLTVQVTTGGER
jgi:hypothetical protein